MISMDQDLATPATETPSQEPTHAPTPETSVRSGLEAAFDAAEAAAPTPSISSATPRVATASPGASPDTPAVDPANVAPTPPPAERAIPERLKGRFADKWATLPPDVKDSFHEYESNIGRLASTYGQRAKSWEESQRVFAPYAEMVQKEGGNYHSAVGNLLETARILRQGSPEQKVVLLRQTASAFGVSLQDLVGIPTQEGQPPRSEPNEALINRLNALEREVLTTRGQESHNARTQVDSEIETFVADTSNIYLQEPGYLDTMATLIRAGKAANLPEAYQQAAWLHERPRQLEIAKANQQRTDSSRDAANRAKRASVSVNGSTPGNVRVDMSKLSLRDALSAAFDGELN